MTFTQVLAIAPIIILAASATAVMVALALVRSHRLTMMLTAGGLVAALAAVGLFASSKLRAVTGLLAVDGLSQLFMVLILAQTLVVTLLAYGYWQRRGRGVEEFYILLLISAAGGLVLACSNHFASLFLGLEILSIPLYALIAYHRRGRLGVEAGFKYLILAGTASAFLLFGMAMVYADLGVMQFDQIAGKLAQSGGGSLLLIVGTGMIIVAAAFKLALAPMHWWTPDVYQGAPAPVTAYIATVSKAAIFAVILRYFALTRLESYQSVIVLLTAVAAASMIVGNLLALLQNNIKRILAYSSIAHMGYLTIVLVAGSQVAPSGGGQSWAVTAGVFYLVAYFITTGGAFGIITVLSGPGEDADSLDDYRGLAWRRPWLAGFLAAMMLSLAGIPLTAGFIGKFYLVAAGVNSGMWLLVVTLLVTSVVGLGYYLRVIAVMYMRQPQEDLPDGQAAPIHVIAVPLLASLTLASLAALLVYLGVYPSGAIEIIHAMIPAIAY